MTVPVLAATRMAGRLTTPFARGADTLVLRLLPFNSSQATVDDYDFTDHQARFDEPPQPRYVLATTRDIDVDTTVTLVCDDAGVELPLLRVPVPAGTVAGTSFVLALPDSLTVRITQVGMQPTPDDNQPHLAWTVTALLGTMAKLLWVLGGERDQLRGYARITLAQRHLPAAVGPSLDLIGSDLGVPRFPPLPYGFDNDTVALYHLDDVAGDTPAVADLTAAYPGRAGHPGTLVGAVQLGVAGRYGQAMAFRVANAAVEVPSDTAFDIPADTSATIECFVRPDPTSDEGPVLSRRALDGSSDSGWVLNVGKFGRGITNNVRFALSDGPTFVQVFADTSLPTDAFTHVAAVLDRAAGFALLYLNGQLTGFQQLGEDGSIGPIANTSPLLIGTGEGTFRGTLDEVRISSVARATFAPTLGEADDHYRDRLELFRRWTLPTPANLTAILNKLVGQIGGQSNPLVVDDTNATLVRGTRLVRVRPCTLLAGESITAAGRRGVAEATAVGTADDEDTFDPAYLFRYDRPDVDFTPAPPRTLRPGEHAPDPHLLQIAVAQRLDRLVTLAGTETAQPGRLLVDGAYDPRAGDLRATGRAVLLGHSSVSAGRLAALAQVAGFDFVSHRPGSGAGHVYAASALEDYFRIDVAPAGTGPTDLDNGATVALSLLPAPPTDAFVRWLTVPGGAGQGTLTPVGAPGTPQQTASLLATAAGQLIVKADVTRGRHSVSATHALRVGLTDLADGAMIAADGTVGAPASIVDDPNAFFDQAFLVHNTDSRINYGPTVSNLMQPAVAELLNALLTELGRRAVSGQLSVTAGFVAISDDLSAKQGRQLVLRHSTLAPGALAGIAFAVGFGHLQRDGADLTVRQAPGQLVEVRGPDGVDTGAIIELDEGTTMELTATPTPATLLTAGLAGQVAGEGPRVGWASGTYDAAAITLGSSTQPVSQLHADSAGMAWVQASYLIGAAPVPYTFQVRLLPALDTPTTVISKDQHDLIMNVLNVLHPVGVEVNTNAIRSHVIELRTSLLLANPDYTYPKFRVRGTLPPQVRRTAHG